MTQRVLNYTHDFWQKLKAPKSKLLSQIVVLLDSSRDDRSLRNLSQ